MGLTPPLATHDRQLIFVPEDMRQALGLNQTPLNPQSITLPTLPWDGLTRLLAPGSVIVLPN